MAKSRTADSSSPQADETAAGVATSAATELPAAAEASSALPAGESAPAGGATQGSPSAGAQATPPKARYRVTLKSNTDNREAGDVFYVDSVHSAHAWYSREDDVYDTKHNRGYAEMLKERATTEAAARKKH